MGKMWIAIFIISGMLRADISPEEIWHNIYDSGKEERCYDIAIDKDGNIYAAGYQLFNGVNSEIFIVKYNSTGEVEWNTLYDIIGSYATSVAVDNESCVYIGGYFKTGHYNRILLKYNSAGQLIWAEDSTTENDRYIMDIAFLNDNIYAGGESNDGFMVVKYDKEGDIIFDEINKVGGQNQGRGIFVDKNGYIYLCGFTQTETSNCDIVTMKCDSSGNIVWEKRYNYSSFDEGNSVVCDKEGNVYTVGRVPAPSYYNLVLLKYGPSGNLIWNKFYDSGRGDGSSSLCIDEANDLYIGEYSGNNLRLIKYTSDGTLLWETEFETNTQPLPFFEPAVVGVDSHGYVYAAGSYYNGNNHDFCVVKYRQFLHINGYVMDENGNFKEGVVVELTGDGEEKDTTDINGYYEFTNLPNDGNYKVKVITDGEYLPHEYEYTPLIYNRNLQNFSLQGIADKKGGRVSIKEDNKRIIVEYFLPEKEFVEIDLFDISGRKLNSFGEEKASGSYLLSWDVENAGIYFIRYKTSNSFYTKKIIIVK